MTPRDAPADVAHGLDFLAEPVLVTTIDGQITEANAAAKAMFGIGVVDGKIADIVLDQPEAWQRLLKQASGSSSPRPGKLQLKTLQGPQTCVVQAARSKVDSDVVQVILRLDSQSGERFAMLDKQVKHLGARLHDNLRRNADLEEALQQNKVLLRELQHRVKNNIQLIMSLTKLSAQRFSSPDVASVVTTLRGRLQAMAAAQEALYQAAEVEHVPAQEFLRGVVVSAARATGAARALTLDLDDANLSSDEAHGLALIANELITNATKYGLPDGQGEIMVSFKIDQSDFRFEVRDSGPGINEDAISRSSGLALVRGLCRQIGGRLEIDGTNGTTCTVIFRASHAEGT